MQLIPDTPVLTAEVLSNTDGSLRDYIMSVEHYLRAPTQVAVHSTRFFEIRNWLSLAVSDSVLGRWQDQWILSMNDLEDFTAFKLAFKPL
jgi:hypothetical protein